MKACVARQTSTAGDKPGFDLRYVTRIARP